METTDITVDRGSCYKVDGEYQVVATARTVTVTIPDSFEGLFLDLSVLFRPTTDEEPDDHPNENKQESSDEPYTLFVKHDSKVEQFCNPYLEMYFLSFGRQGEWQYLHGNVN